MSKTCRSLAVNTDHHPDGKFYNGIVSCRHMDMYDSWPDN